MLRCSKTKELSLTSSHTWFKAHVKSWISLVITRCKALIQKSIDFNETVTDKIKISTSAVDTTGFLVQVAEFWRRLDWPEATVAYSMMVYMLQEVSDLAHFYVQQVYQARMEKYKSLSTFAASDDVRFCSVVVVVVAVCCKELHGKSKGISRGVWLSTFKLFSLTRRK